MSDLGLLHYFLGIEVSQVKEGIFISLKKYTKSILQKFKMMDCRSMAIPLAANEKFRKDDGAKKANSSLYRSLIGSLLYLTSTRPDIMFAASLLSRFMQEPSQVHFGATKRVLHHLQGTMDYGIMYKFDGDLDLIGYSDSDWAGRIDDMKSTSVILSYLVQAFVLGCQKSKVLLLNPLPMQNMSQQLRLLLKLFGLGECLKILVKNKKE
ncbi:uncharacterized mitochondrial protein AtMg00240-like [Lycium ferocissimum]|uniref:uncharacterized mitochondrial protein AtMg00240-like n=1 Tax=Lycium ferocissimum TaxID=112874 RepID=UPI002815D900|nr:uncharacterized mitochondrial protein AtMg00240-like [Lycium ferocissimum]